MLTEHNPLLIIQIPVEMPFLQNSLFGTIYSILLLILQDLLAIALGYGPYGWYLELSYYRQHILLENGLFGTGTAVFFGVSALVHHSDLASSLFFFERREASARLREKEVFWGRR